MNSSHLDDDDLIDLHDAQAPTEDRPAPAVEISRPTPVELLCRWELRPVAVRSANPLQEPFL